VSATPISRRATPGGRRHVGNALTALVVALFVGGMLVPFVVDRDVTTVVQSAPGIPGGSAADDGAAGPSGDGSVAEGVTAGGTAGAAAGSGPGGTRGAASAGTGGTGAQEPTDSDVGVSKTEIRIAVMTVTLGAFDALATESGLTVDDQKAAWNAVFTAENAAGGFAGRKLVPVFQTYDASDLSRESMRQACVSAGEDLDVFAVLAIYWVEDPVVCITERYKMPLLNIDQQPDDYYRRSNGLLIGATPSLERGMRNLIWQAHELGVLQGKTIGILAYASPSDTAAVNDIRSTLGQLGHSVAQVSRITLDASQMAAQMAVEVQAMKRAGVQIVIAPIGAPSWYDEAERQDWRPRYLFSDAYTGCYENPNKASTQAGPNGGRQLDGALAVCATNAGNRVPAAKPHAGEQRCLDIAKGVGRSAPAGSVADLLNMQSCSLAHLLGEGLRRAGINPTRASFAAAVAQLKEIEIPGAPPGNGFPPGRSDYGVLVRANEFETSCSCFRPITGWLPARF
jgi:hypothetical protein